MPALRRTISIVLAGTMLAGAIGIVAAQEADPRRESRAARFIEMFDTDLDGFASLTELTDEHERLFGAVDLDGDGALSVAEFRRRGALFQRLGTTTLFDLIDVNGDQRLTVDELSSPAARWFTRYDVNGDGVLDADELAVRGGRR